MDWIRIFWDWVCLNPEDRDDWCLDVGRSAWVPEWIYILRYGSALYSDWSAEYRCELVSSLVRLYSPAVAFFLFSRGYIFADIPRLPIHLYCFNTVYILQTCWAIFGSPFLLLFTLLFSVKKEYETHQDSSGKEAGQASGSSHTQGVDPNPGRKLWVARAGGVLIDSRCVCLNKSWT